MPVIAVDTMNSEEKALEASAKFVAQKGLRKFTRFLDPLQAAQAEYYAKENGVRVTSWGGYEQAERTVICFHPWDEEVNSCEFPIICLRSKISNRFCTITHRDLLGAFMALGLTRSCIGDMIINESDVFLFTSEQTADFVVSSMTSAGKMPLSFSVHAETPTIPDPLGTEFSAIVSSLRLDNVLSSAYKLSRSESAEAIRNGLVKVNHLPCERIDTILKEDTLLSLRGRGRVRLTRIGGLTKKQRIGITLFRYE